MFYRTIDYLACPLDKTPLLLEKVAKSMENTREICNSQCRFFCSFKGCPVSGDVLSDCGNCRTCDIITASMKCPSCGSIYPVVEGIALLLPPEKLLSSEMQTGMVTKKREMEERDESAGSYDSKYSSGRNLLEISSFMRRLSISGKDLVLELGSGTGRLTMSMAPLAGEIICMDLSLESLKELSRKHREKPDGCIHLVQADMNFLPLRDEYKFEKIASSGAIHHIPAGLENEALKEIDRHLAAGGIFVVSVYNHSDMTEESREKKGFHSDRIYFYRYDSGEFRQFLSNVFEVEEIAGIINLPTHKVVGSLMRIGLSKVALFLEFMIQRTTLSFRRGEMLIAVCRKRK